VVNLPVRDRREPGITNACRTQIARSPPSRAPRTQTSLATLLGYVATVDDPARLLT
jgi:hypothetical protein